MAVYDFTDYKSFLKHSLERGTQKRFAEQLRCQPAFLSQVLRGKPHLSLEQGILATDYFRMNKSEAEFFMLALQYGRAGSERLRQFFMTRMEALRASNRRVEHKIGVHEQLDDLAKAQFYSSWKFALVHVLLSVPMQGQSEYLQERTGLTKNELQRCLEFLKGLGLISGKSGRFQPTKKRIHLHGDDPLVGIHHKNFRLLTLRSLEERKDDSLHFSSAMAISKIDAEKIRKLLLEAISDSEAILRPSPEETVRIFNLDLFEP